MTPDERKEDIDKLSKIAGFKIPLDGFLMALEGRPVIDILKLDDRLMKVYNYKGSMNNFVKKQFGEEAFRILNQE